MSQSDKYGFEHKCCEERDEARAQLAELETLRGPRDRGQKPLFEQLRGELDHYQEVIDAYSVQGGQLAALREALTDIAKAKHDNASLMRKTAEIALSDTAGEQKRDYDETQSAFSVVREHLAAAPAANPKAGEGTE